MTPRSGDFLFFPSWLRHGVKKSYFKKKGARRGGFHEPRRGLGSHCPSEPLATRSAAGRQLHRGARAIVGSRPSQEACAQIPMFAPKLVTFLFFLSGPAGRRWRASLHAASWGHGASSADPRNLRRQQSLCSMLRALSAPPS
ncbi:unnamed protein product [Prorocentrum cordatum]|uniref:Uncharacterized protein n=1 Tax=Prorocentrum cordatum TaxID=2364126 RepID=A0ABN9WCN6_9DINO|nr:unnamed protein product [Polarella glacialis]